jgi:hypothetical protein
MKIFVITFAWLLPVAAIAQANPNHEPDRTWITDVNIVSPEKLDHIENGSVLIEDGQIVRVERRTNAKPARATVVFGKRTVSDSRPHRLYVHLTLLPMSDDQAASKPEVTNRYFQQLPRSYLYYGYDACRFGRRGQSTNCRSSGVPSASDLYTCGDALVLANGYPMSFTRRTRLKLFPNFIYDPEQGSAIPPEYRPQDHTPEADIARVKSSGGICIKTFFEHGFGRNANLPFISPAVLADIREHARQAGLVLILHANSF